MGLWTGKASKPDHLYLKPPDEPGKAPLQNAQEDLPNISMVETCIWDLVSDVFLRHFPLHLEDHKCRSLYLVGVNTVASLDRGQADCTLRFCST